MPKHPEPLVSRTLQLAQRQVDALEERRRVEGRQSLSGYVRDAVDLFLANDDAAAVADAQPEPVTA